MLEYIREMKNRHSDPDDNSWAYELVLELFIRGLQLCLDVLMVLWVIGILYMLKPHASAIFAGVETFFQNAKTLFESLTAYFH